MIDANMVALPRTLNIQQGRVPLNALNPRTLIRGVSLKIFRKKTIIILLGILLSICLFTVVSKFVSVFVLDDFPDEDNVVIPVN